MISFLIHHQMLHWLPLFVWLYVFLLLYIVPNSGNFHGTESVEMVIWLVLSRWLDSLYHLARTSWNLHLKCRQNDKRQRFHLPVIVYLTPTRPLFRLHTLQIPPLTHCCCFRTVVCFSENVGWDSDIDKKEINDVKVTLKGNFFSHHPATEHRWRRRCLAAPMASLESGRSAKV